MDIGRLTIQAETFSVEVNRQCLSSDNMERGYSFCRELQRLKELQVQSPHRRNGFATPHVSYYFIPSDNVFHILLFICIFVVILAAVRYLMSLRRLKATRNRNSHMTRNKSLMSYMMLDEDDMGDGFNLLKNVRIEQSSYVY